MRALTDTSALPGNRTRLELNLDKHGTNAHPRNLLQTPLARELSFQTSKCSISYIFHLFIYSFLKKNVCPSAKLETPRPTTPQTYIGAYGHEHRPILSPHQGTFDVNMSSYPGTPGKINLHKNIPR